MKIQTVTIGRLCSNKGCKRVARQARWFNNFWISYCDDCWGKVITLDMDKIPTPQKGAATL
jgi:hypothetical protein